MSTWDKTDREVWNKSEVMRELEKKVAHSIGELSTRIKKTADMKELPADLAKVNQEAGPAADSLGKVETAVDKLYSADDEEIADSETEEVEELQEEIKEVAADLIEELTKLSYQLADDGDTELAYKVERVIQDIQSGFVSDED